MTAQKTHEKIADKGYRTLRKVSKMLLLYITCGVPFLGGCKVLFGGNKSFWLTKILEHHTNFKNIQNNSKTFKIIRKKQEFFQKNCYFLLFEQYFDLIFFLLAFFSFLVLLLFFFLIFWSGRGEERNFSIFFDFGDFCLFFVFTFFVLGEGERIFFF